MVPGWWDFATPPLKVGIDTVRAERTGTGVEIFSQVSETLNWRLLLPSAVDLSSRIRAVVFSSKRDSMDDGY